MEVIDVGSILLQGVSTWMNEIQRTGQIQQNWRQFKNERQMDTGFSMAETLDGLGYYLVKWELVDSIKLLRTVDSKDPIDPLLWGVSILKLPEGTPIRQAPFEQTGYPDAWRRPRAALQLAHEAELLHPSTTLTEALDRIGERDTDFEPARLMSEEIKCLDRRAADAAWQQAMDRQRNLEDRLRISPKGNETAAFLDSLRQAIEATAPFRLSQGAYRRLGKFSLAITRAEILSALLAGPSTGRFLDYLTQAIPPARISIEQELFGFFLEAYVEGLEAGQIPPLLRDELLLTGKDYDRLARRLFTNTLLFKPDLIGKLLVEDEEAGRRALSQDFFYLLLRQLAENHRIRIEEPLAAMETDLRRGYRKYHRLVEVAYGSYPNLSDSYLDLGLLSACDLHLSWETVIRQLNLKE